MPQFETAFWVSQVFWLLVSFGGLYLGIRFIVFPMFEQIFEKRTKQIKIPLEKAEKLAQEVQQLQQQSAQKKAAFAAKHQQLLSAAHHQEMGALQDALEKKEKELTRRLKHQIQTVEQNEKQVWNTAPEFIQKAVKGIQ